MREVAIADITRIVISSDRDGDMTINLKELNELTLRLELTLEMLGIDLDGEAFKTMVRKDNDISHVLKVIEAIMFEETIDGKEVDEYADEARHDEVRQDDLVGALAAASVVGRIRRLANSTGSDEVDETPMFTLQDRFTRGSVAAARGTRVSLSKGMKGPSSRTSQVMRQTVNVVKTSHILQHVIEENYVGDIQPVNEESYEGIREGLARDQNMRDLNASPSLIESDLVSSSKSGESSDGKSSKSKSSNKSDSKSSKSKIGKIKGSKAYYDRCKELMKQSKSGKSKSSKEGGKSSAKSKYSKNKGGDGR